MHQLKNIHPGEILLYEFLIPMDISQDKVARDIGVPLKIINDIVNKNKSITSDLSLELARYFKLSDEFFLELQKDYDLEDYSLKN